MFNKAVLLVCVVSLSLAGCTTLKKMSGSTNDTILPGAREDILPPDQQTARDPAVTGQPAPGGAIQQQTLAQPGQPNMPQTAQKGDLLPANNGTVVACDPLTQTCPGMAPQPKMAAKSKPAEGKVLVAPGGKVAASAKTKSAKVTADAPPADASAAAATGTDPMKPEVKAAKKKIKKKLVAKPKDAAPAAPDAAAAPDATQTPPPVVPPDVKTP